MQFKKPIRKTSRSSIIGPYLKDNQSVYASARQHGDMLSQQSEAAPVEADEDVSDRILELLGPKGKLQAHEIFEKLNISSSKAMRLLSALESFDVVRRDKDDEGNMIIVRNY